MKKSLLLAAAGILAVASFASAANREGQFSLSPMVGGLVFENKQRVENNAFVSGIRAGYNFTQHIGIEALFDYANTTTRQAYGNKDANVFRYGAEGLYNFFPTAKLVPYVAAGAGAMNIKADGLNNKAKTMLDWGVGAKYFLTDNVALRGDVRHIVTKDDRWKNNLEYMVGAYIPFGGAAPAVKPVEPEPVPVPKVVKTPVAPAAITAALTATPTKVTKGQSSTLNWSSQNASGCEIQPGIGPVPPQGAKVVSPNADTAYTLSCSGAGGTATSAANVAVSVPAPAPVVEAPKAAPSAAAEKYCNKPAEIKILFDTGKSNIKPKYDAELKSVSEFLKEFPKAKGEISGHTDNVGGKAYNQKLSQARADSVSKYIVQKFGISADRIVGKGYGFSKPVASNKTKEGKSKNRRIEANFTCE